MSLQKIVYLTNAQAQTLFANGTITVDGVTVNYSPDDLYVTPSGEVTDVQVNGSSVVNNGIANIPYATGTNNSIGVVGVNSNYGIAINTAQPGKYLYLNPATDAEIKNAVAAYKAVAPYKQHSAAFYGLAKASGDTTQASSSNAVGTYTDEAKVAIQKMLGIYEAPWELINEETFTNATEADHIITTDSDGHPFELTDIVLMFETPTQSTASGKGYYGQVQYSNNTTIKHVLSSESWTQSADASAHGFYQVIERRNGLIFKSQTQQAPTGGNENLRMTYPETFANSSAYTAVVPITDNSTITSVNIKAVTGTGHYKLYGKRKWE